MVRVVMPRIALALIAETLNAAAARLAQAGVPPAVTAQRIEAADPWGTRVRIVRN